MISPLELAVADLSRCDILVTAGLSLTADAAYAPVVMRFVRRGGGLLGFLPARSENDASLFGVKGKLLPESSTVPLTRAGLDGTLASFMAVESLKPEAIVFDRGLVLDTTPEIAPRLVSAAGPIAVECRADRGQALLFGFLPYQGWSNLQLNPNFVQILLRALWSAEGRRPLLALSGLQASVAQPGLRPGPPAGLWRGDEKTGEVEIAGLGEDTRFLLPRGLTPGLYSIRQDETELLRFGFSAGAEDSALEPVTEADLAPAIRNGLVFSTGAAMGRDMTRRELWLPVLILLLLAAGVELYAHFFREPAIRKT